MRRGLAVTVVDQSAQPMTTLDPDMGAAVHRAMKGIGIDVHTDTTVVGFEADRDHRIRSVLTAHGSIPADVVVLGLGVRPNTALARQAGLPLGDHGGLRTNLQMRVLGHDRIWAGGDCVEVLNLVSGQYQHVPLGTHANKQGRVIGHNTRRAPTPLFPVWSAPRSARYVIWRSPGPVCASATPNAPGSPT